MHFFKESFLSRLELPGRIEWNVLTAVTQTVGFGGNHVHMKYLGSLLTVCYFNIF